MRICECTVENFGTLKNFECKLSEGLCALVEKNGKGKTTLAVFIKAMLYGLDDTRKTKLSENARKHYLPWNGETCRGSLTIEAGGKKYRIERSFGNKAADDSFKLYDLKTGLVSSDFSENIGEELFGIDADGFERTLFLSESNLSGKNENKSIAAKLSDLTGSERDLGSLDEALALLDEERKFYRKRGGAGEISDINDRIAECNRNLSDIERKREEYARLHEEKKELDARLEGLIGKQREIEKENERRGEMEIRRQKEKSYFEGLASLEREQEQKKELETFFNGRIPTRAELEDIMVKRLERQRIALSLKNAGFIDEGQNEGAIRRVRELKGIARELESSERVIGEKSLMSEREGGLAKEIFSELVPSETEISNYEKTALKGSKKGLLFLICSCAFALVGIALAFLKPYLLALSLLSLPFLFIYLRGGKNNAELYSFASKYSSRQQKKMSAEQLISHLKNELEAYNAHMSRKNALECEIESVRAHTQKQRERAEELLSELGFRGIEPSYDAICELELEFTKREAEMGVYRRENRELAERYKLLTGEIDEFLSRYSTNSADTALEEIRAALYEYERICDSLKLKSEELSIFALQNGIDKSRAQDEKNTEQSNEKIDTGAILSEISELQRRDALIKRAMDECEDRLELEDEYRARAEQLKRREAEATSSYKAIEGAISYLKAASENLNARYLKKMRSAFTEYMKIIAKESENLEIDTHFSVRRREGAGTKESEYYSRGTQDLYALAVRFALIDALYEGEEPFVILDDPFAYFDDEKLPRALSVLKEMGKKRQIIYLTCTRSRGI